MAVTKFKTTSSFTNLTKYDSMLAGNDPYKPGVYESIASTTGTGASGTITFSSIPSTYVALQVRITARDTNAAATIDSIRIRLNNDSATNYVRHSLNADDTTLTASGNITQNSISFDCIAQGNTAANIVGAAIVDFHDYASTTRNKTLRFIGGGNLNGSGSSRLNVGSGLWLNTAAVNRIDFLAQAFWSTQTTIALYGIKGA